MDLFLGHIGITVPPFFKDEIPVLLGIYVGIKVVLLGPQRVSGVEVFKILLKPRTVERPVSQVRQP